MRKLLIAAIAGWVIVALGGIGWFVVYQVQRIFVLEQQMNAVVQVIQRSQKQVVVEGEIKE